MSLYAPLSERGLSCVPHLCHRPSATTGPFGLRPWARSGASDGMVVAPPPTARHELVCAVVGARLVLRPAPVPPAIVDYRPLRDQAMGANRVLERHARRLRVPRHSFDARRNAFTTSFPAAFTCDSMNT